MTRDNLNREFEGSAVSLISEMMTETEMLALSDLIVHGDNVPSNIADNIDRSRSAVTKAMPELEERGLVENKGRGVYRLTWEGFRRAQQIAAAKGDIEP